MKKIVKAAITASLIAFASVAVANPKCSHRVASSSNDLFKDTNPVRTAKAAKPADVRETQTQTGVR